MFRTSFRLFWGIVIACVLLAVSTQPIQTVFAEVDTPAPDVDSTTVDPPAQPHRLFLPLVDRQVNYTGRVTFKGAPAANITVKMYMTSDNWATSALFSIAITDAAGYYQFTNLPALHFGNQLGVEWLNSDDSYVQPYLAGWVCGAVEGLRSDQLTCDFDIQDIVLNSPAHYASVSLPAIFSWYPRAATTDLYEVNWWDPDLDHYYWTPKLPYTSAYRLYAVPETYLTGFPYNWSMVAYGANGYGFSYWYRWVTFNNHGNASLTGVSPVSELLSAENGDNQAALRSKLKRLDKFESRPAADGQKSMP